MTVYMLFVNFVNPAVLQLLTIFTQNRQQKKKKEKGFSWHSNIYVLSDLQ